MKELPIIFSAPMVRALLDGRKTQTRRILKPQPSKPFGGIFCDAVKWWTGDSLTGEVIESLRVPYAVGDRLWVREAWRVRAGKYDRMKPADLPQTATVLYEADPFEKGIDYGKRRPSIHMPRWASRITLEVTEVRVQRLQEISGEDTIVEGVQCPTCEAMKYSACHDSGCFHSLQLFKELWNGLHGPGAWEANPWVAAISFKRVT